MIIVLMGPPGVGKGTQSRMICQLYQLPHLSTGELLRKAAQSGTELGREVAQFIDFGQLAPDKIVVDLVADFLTRYAEGCLLDGFPRTIPQAEQFAEFLGRTGRVLTVVIELQVDRQELERRLGERAGIEGRADDTSAAIGRRMALYEQRTMPLVDFYRQRQCWEAVSGIGTPADVLQRIREVVDRRSGPCEVI